MHECMVQSCVVPDDTLIVHVCTVQSLVWFPDLQYSI